MPKTERLQINLRVEPEFEAELDELRGLIRPIPTKSDAIRMAVREALERRRKTALARGGR